MHLRRTSFQLFFKWICSSCIINIVFYFLFLYCRTSGFHGWYSIYHDCFYDNTHHTGICTHQRRTILEITIPWVLVVCVSIRVLVICNIPVSLCCMLGAGLMRFLRSGIVFQKGQILHFVYICSLFRMVDWLILGL